MAKASVSCSGGGSYCKSVTFDAKALSALRSALNVEDAMSAEEAAKQGYVSVEDFAGDNMTSRTANNLLNQSHAKGKLDRVKVKRNGARWCYWYKAKSS